MLYPIILPIKLSKMSSISKLPNVENNWINSTPTIMMILIKIIFFILIIRFEIQGKKKPIGKNKIELPKIFFIKDDKLIEFSDILEMYSAIVLNGSKLIDRFMCSK